MSSLIFVAIIIIMFLVMFNDDDDADENTKLDFWSAIAFVALCAILLEVMG